MNETSMSYSTPKQGDVSHSMSEVSNRCVVCAPGVYVRYLRSAHKVSKCGRNSYHIYVPKELEGREIIGLILSEDPNV